MCTVRAYFTDLKKETDVCPPSRVKKIKDNTNNMDNEDRICEDKSANFKETCIQSRALKKCIVINHPLRYTHEDIKNE